MGVRLPTPTAELQHCGIRAIPAIQPGDVGPPESGYPPTLYYVPQETLQNLWAAAQAPSRAAADAAYQRLGQFLREYENARHSLHPMTHSVRPRALRAPPSTARTRAGT